MKRSGKASLALVLIFTVTFKQSSPNKWDPFLCLALSKKKKVFITFIILILENIRCN